MKAGKQAFTIGIDLGTHSVKAMALAGDGTALARAEAPLPPAREGTQDTAAWFDALATVLHSLTAGPALGQPVSAAGCQGLAVTGTSGTIVPCDTRGRPLGPAFMYHDTRPWREAAEVGVAAGHGDGRPWDGLPWDASWGLPKLLWLKRHEPGLYRSMARLAHAADTLAARLAGEALPTDHTSALKSGFDPAGYAWRLDLVAALDLDGSLLPPVVRPGSPVGCLSPEAAAASGLPAGLPILAGCTDGVAGQIASGAMDPGQWNSTLGTTLILKGTAPRRPPDSGGLVYCHLHPDGLLWLPGAASQAGGGALEAFPPPLAAWDERAAAFLPTPVLHYPNPRQGERFPFRHTTATAFTDGTPRETAELFAAALQGLAFVERLGYERIAQLGLPVEGGIITTGGGAKSRRWMQVRADVLDRVTVVPRHADPAAGAAMLAWSGLLGEPVARLSQRFAVPQATFSPDPARGARYSELYGYFLVSLRRRGYLP